MNTSTGPVRPTPRNLNPPDDLCFQLSVPNDPEWIAAFYDALYQLTLWMAWQRDDAHTGKDIAARWWHTLNSVQLCREVQAPSGCPDPGEDYLIRQNPDNPCLIETSADGTNWCTLVDLALCTAPTGQPGSGARQPLPGGGDACYHGKLNAAQTWLLPTVVNAGDVLDFTAIQGAGTDGSGHWYCPDGQIFFAGACVGSLSFDGADPAPAIHHMAIVALIGAVYYDITAGPITVPGGISNAPVTLQVNDSALGNNAGDYNFDVCVTNNQALTYTHTFLFALSPEAFTLASSGVWTPPTFGVWTAGQGWVGTASASGGSHHHGISLLRSFAHRTIYTAELHFNLTKGTVLAGLTNGLYLDRSGVTVASHTIASDAETNGTDKTYSVTPGSYDTDQIEIVIHDSFYNSGADGASLVAKLILTGPGADPW